jgi:hypothetical protein
MNKLITLLLAVFLLSTPLPAAAQTAEAPQEASEVAAVADDDRKDRYERRAGRRDRFYFNVGGVFLGHDTIDQLNARDAPLGTVIDWEDVFGLPERTTDLRVEGHFKLAPRHRFRFSWYNTRRSGEALILEGGLQWGEITIPEDVIVTSSWNTRLIRGDYRYSIILSDRVDVGLALGVYLLRVESRIDINAVNLKDEASVSAPLPVVGIDIEWDFADNFVFRGGYQLLGVKVGDTTKVDGSWSEIRARVEWMPTRNFGLGIGYLGGRVDVNVDFTENTILRSWDMTYNTGGLNAYALVSF